MNPSVAPTRRMIAISRLRCSTAMRMVVPMMMMATTANAAPTTSPTAAASCRSRSSFSTQSRPNRTSSTKPNPRSRSATSFTWSASRKPGLSFTSSDAGSGLRSSSWSTSRNSTSSARARARALSSVTYVADWTSGNASMSLTAMVTVSTGVPGSRYATISTRSATSRSACCRFTATRPNRPTTNSEKAMVVTDSTDSRGARWNVSSASRRTSFTCSRPGPGARPRSSRTPARPPGARSPGKAPGAPGRDRGSP